MKISNEVKVGILTLSALIVLIVGYNFLRGKKIFSRQQEFYSVYIDAKGILPANPVRMRGVQVGIIESITPQPDYSVLVTMSVNKGVNIPRNTVATIVSDGLLGEMAMNCAHTRKSRKSNDYPRLYLVGYQCHCALGRA